MQKINFLLHSYHDGKETTLHGCCTNLNDAQVEISSLARNAFIEATKEHKLISSFGATDIPILSFEHYSEIAKCPTPHATYFLANHCLVFANEECTMIELLQWSIETKSSWFGWASARVEGPKLIQTFAVLGTDERPEGVPLVLKTEIPAPPPMPEVAAAKPAKKTNRVSQGIKAPCMGFPITEELKAKILKRKNELEMSCTVTEAKV